MVSEERFDFGFSLKKGLLITLAVGIILTVIGLLIPSSHMSHHEDVNMEVQDPYGNETNVADSEHAAGVSTSKKLFVNLWINSVFFTGLSIIGIFFFALQYATQSGWSVGIKRIPFSFGAWLPVGFIIMIVIFFLGGHDLFHWTHTNLYHEGSSHFDAIINGKKAFFFWPLDEHPNFPFFWVLRLVLFFGVWYWFMKKMTGLIKSEDLDATPEKWFKMRKIAAIFIIIFAVSSSVAAWDWIMSIDTHWFSTMFGWYAFASWWVTGLALTLFLVMMLKSKGYLSIVNQNHIHDLSKLVFGFSIFWTYIWFSQFLLIYYAHIPEETIYFMERWKSDHYAPIFYINLILNFVLPFLLLMTRDAKRHVSILKVVCPIIIFGHWLDFYLMIAPGTLGTSSSFGLLEIGLILVFISVFLFLLFNKLKGSALFAKNHPMLKESLNHHI